MTYDQWHEQQLLLRDLKDSLRDISGKVSDRKIRLYLCGGCRQIAHLLFCPYSSAAVDVAERFADGQAAQEELKDACYNAEAATFGFELDSRQSPYGPEEPYRRAIFERLVEMGCLLPSVLSGGEYRVEPPQRDWLLAAASLAYRASASTSGSLRWLDGWFRYVCDLPWPGRWLVECVFGNPYRWPQIDPNWQTPAVLSAATAAYEHRIMPQGTLDPSLLSKLAEALREAGCGEEAILAHLKTGTHVRGCHIVDLLLDRR